MSKRLPLLGLLPLLVTTNLVFAQEGNADETAEEPQKPERERVEGALPWEWSEQLEWRSIGPANMGGRIISVAAHPEDRSTYWIGTAAGGLLKTENNGVTYEHQFSDENTCSVGAVEVSRSNPDVVWVGTGENNPRNSVSWGDGVYKSTDGGDTWTHMGLKDSFQISTIIIHPDDENVVWVGALGRLWGPNEERGLFKTTDGGETWEKVLYVDDQTGVIDIRMKPDDPEVLLVATYERERDIYCSNDPAKKWGPGSAIYRTTDGGKNFTKVTKGLPTVEIGRIGLDWYVKDTNVVYAIVESARITQEPENAAYAGVSGEDAEVGARLTEITEDGPAAKAGLETNDILLRVGGQTMISWDAVLKKLREHVAGDTVEVEVVRDRESMILDLTFETRPVPEDEEEEDRTDVHGRPNPGPFHGGLGGQRENIQNDQGADGFEFGGVYRSDDAGETWTRINSVNPRPMYYSEIRVDPSDNNHIYVLGTSLYRSSDGGETFTPDGHDRSVHVDHHAMWVDPHDGRHIILGNDGGIYVTWDRMERWDHHNHVAIGQFYNITCDPTPDYKVYGGLQDNGSWGGPSRVRDAEGPMNSDWFRVGGGDGFVCRVDVNDPDLVYYESQNGGMGRRHLRTGEGGFVRPSAPRGTRYRFNWNTPFILSNHNSKIHYSAGNHVFRSLDRGNASRRISPDVTTTDRGSATSLAESHFDSDVLYVGTDDGGLWMTKDGGHEWIDLWALNEGLGPKVEAAPKASTVSYTAPEAPEALEALEAPETAAANDDDPISGLWKCKATGEGIDESGEGGFELELKLGEKGAVSGHMSSDIGEGKISKGRWNAESGKLSFEFKNENFTLQFAGDVDGKELSGDISAAGGAFSFTFSGERTGDSDAGHEEAEEKPAKKSAEKPEASKEAVVAATQDDEPEAKDEDEDEEEPKEKKRKFKKDTIDQLVPGRRYVSSITPSRHKRGRVYLTLDGHRSNDDEPYVFVSDDFGETWDSVRGNLPTSVGSVRDLEEDLENRELLFLGTEFGAWVSIDEGKSWSDLGANLPTVPVHDFAMHPTSGELIAGTHGRSVWVLDITPLRQLTESTMDEDAHLYAPNKVIRWQSQPGRGSSGTRSFVGDNGNRSAQIYYSLDKTARDIKLEVRDPAGEVIRELEAPGSKGLHRVAWDMRQGVTREDRQGNRRFRRGRTVAPGTYKVVLTVGEETYSENIEIVNDPDAVGTEWMEFEALEEEWLEALEEGGGER